MRSGDESLEDNEDYIVGSSSPRLRTLSEGGVIGEELRTVYILAYTLLSHFSLYVKKHLKFLLTYSKIDFFWVILWI